MKSGTRRLIAAGLFSTVCLGALGGHVWGGPADAERWSANLERLDRVSPDSERGLLSEASPAIQDAYGRSPSASADSSAVQHTQDRPVDVPDGMLLPVARANARTLPACAAEDGPGPCYWDASSAGNGVGHSFYIDEYSCTHYFLPTDEARWGDKSSPCEDPYA